MLPGEEFSEDDGGDRVAAWAVMAGLVALYAAALALWAPDGVPWGRSHRHVEPPAAEAGRAAAARGRDPALPVSRLCFRGPRGEPVDAPGAQENCSPGAADAGLRVAGAAQ